MGGFVGLFKDVVAHLVCIFGVDVVFNRDKTLFAKVLGCNLHQVGNFRLSDIRPHSIMNCKRTGKMKVYEQ